MAVQDSPINDSIFFYQEQHIIKPLLFAMQIKGS